MCWNMSLTWMRVIAETARVLKPGGIYLFDTINRTLLSKLIAIKLIQDWKWSRVRDDEPP